MSNKHILIALIYGFFCVVLAVLILPACCTQQVSHDDKKVRTETLLRTLSLVSSYHEYDHEADGDVKTQFFESVSELLGDGAVSDQNRDNVKMLFIDYWGNPIQYIYDENGENIIGFRSNGENGVWDNGTGDDLEEPQNK